MKRRSSFLWNVLMWSLLRCGVEAGAQENPLSYQVILETRGEYNNLDKQSQVNPQNRMQIDVFTSITQLYPILKFSETFGAVTTRLQAEADIRNFNLDKDSTDFFMQELYAQFSVSDRHFWVIGKKRLDWGTGMIWNPTNFHIRKDPLRTQNRLEGIFMASYSFLFKSSTWSAYLFPAKRKEEVRAALRYEYSGNRVDAGISLLEEGRYQQFGYELSYGADRFTLYSEGVLRNRARSYTIGKTGTLVAPGEWRKRFRGEWVAGTMCSVNAHISVSAEYRFRQEGLGREEIDVYKRHLPEHPVLFDPLSVGKHSLFGSMDWKDTYGRWSAQLRTFYDPVSGQWMISPLGIWTMNNFQVELSVMGYNRDLAIHRFQSAAVISCFF